MLLPDFPGKNMQFYLWKLYLRITLPCVPWAGRWQAGQRASLPGTALDSRGSVGKSNSPNLKKEQKDSTVFTQINTSCQQENIWLLCFFLSICLASLYLLKLNLKKKKTLCRERVCAQWCTRTTEPWYRLTEGYVTRLEVETRVFVCLLFTLFSFCHPMEVHEC